MTIILVSVYDVEVGSDPALEAVGVLEVNVVGRAAVNVDINSRVVDMPPSRGCAVCVCVFGLIFCVVCPYF